MRRKGRLYTDQDVSSLKISAYSVIGNTAESLRIIWTAKNMSSLPPLIGEFLEKPRFLTSIPNDLDTYGLITFGARLQLGEGFRLL